MDDKSRILQYALPTAPRSLSKFSLISLCLACALLAYAPVDAFDLIHVSWRVHEDVWAAGWWLAPLGFILGVVGATLTRGRGVLAILACALNPLAFIVYLVLLPRL